MKVLLYGAPVIPFKQEIVKRLDSDIEVICVDYHEKEKFHREIERIQILITTKLDDSVRLPQTIKLIQCPGMGYDEIALSSISDSTYFCNVGEHENGMAEFALLAMLSLNWNIVSMHNKLSCKDWSYSSRMGGCPSLELKGKCVGVIGYGKVGRTLIKKLCALEIETILVCSRSFVKDDIVSAHYLPEDIENMAALVDYLVVACDIRDDTIGLINDAVLEKMKCTAFLINIARGKVVNEKDLYYALKNKRIRGAHIDVWYNYPTSENQTTSPSRFAFEDLDNVCMTPHVAGWTQRTVMRRWDIICDNITLISNEKPPINIIKMSDNKILR